MSSPTDTVLILGATGRLGAAAMRAFADAGWIVLAQSRGTPTHLPAGAHHLAMDLTQPHALAEAARGARIVLHAVNPPYTGWARHALPLARSGMTVAQQLGATFMLPGNVYNFGAAMPALLREDTPQHPTSRKGAIRCEIEAELSTREAQGLRSVVIRSGDFFGAGTGSWLDLVVTKSLPAGRLVYPGPLDRQHAWAYVPDLARVFVAVGGQAARQTLPPACRLHFAGHALTGAQWLDAVERVAVRLRMAPGHGFRRSGLPWPLLRVGALFVPMLRELVEMAYLWHVPHALDDRALRAQVGALPATDIDTALCAALQAPDPRRDVGPVSPSGA